ncbi:serine/threonine-protein kinase [Streptomyces sp. NPDC057694]|uniref:serine/threonine-protein kinase n=1 Tax=Streptomyces sp. NPDC057694 TaxID=3346216 RepID=UPI0036B2BB3E
MRGHVLSGRYRLLETIGSGGMGQVWRARDEDLGRFVALKLFAPPDDIGADERQELLGRFRREARAVAALSSPYVVTVYDHGSGAAVAGGGDVPFLVMELVDGASLQEMLRSEVRFPVGRALEWARQCALGLAAAHAAGIVHRDIKPGNIMVTPGDPGNVKILDFGIAAFVEGAEAATRLTRTGTLPIGSVPYMAPERFRQEPGDGRVDLYGLGCVLYELLVGRPPFSGPAAGVMYNHLHDTPMRPSRARTGLPAGVDELIAALMAKRAEDRPVDAAAVVGLIDGVAAGAAPHEKPATPMASVAPIAPVTPVAPAAPATSGAAAPAAPQTAPVPAPAPTRTAPPAPTPTPAPRPRLPRPRRLLIGAVVLACAGTGISVAAALNGGEQEPPKPPVSGQPLDQPRFRIAVADRGATGDTRAVARALRDYAGSLPLTAVSVPHADRLSSAEFARKYPDVVAVVGTAAGRPGLVKGTPAVGTCHDDRGDTDGDVRQFAAYLEDVLHTKRLLAPAGEGLGALADRFAASRGSGHGFTTYATAPDALRAGDLRELLARARPDTVYLADRSGRDGNAEALRRAGYRGRIVLAPDHHDDCGAGRRDERVPDGVYRFRTVSKGPFRTGECTQDAAWCARVRPLMTRPGALEEYEATQAVVAAFRARATRDTTAAAVRAHLGAALPTARVHGLQGDYTPGALGLTVARPVWAERYTAGTWHELGTVAGLTRD